MRGKNVPFCIVVAKYTRSVHWAVLECWGKAIVHIALCPMPLEAPRACSLPQLHLRPEAAVPPLVAAVGLWFRLPRQPRASVPVGVTAVLWNGQRGVVSQRTSAELSPAGANKPDSGPSEFRPSSPCTFLKQLTEPKGCCLVLHGFSDARWFGCYFPYNPLTSGNMTNNPEMWIFRIHITKY